VEDNQDGTYRCTYVTNKAGEYKIIVTLNGGERLSTALVRPRAAAGC
jgi:hypothetical protein